MGTGWPKSMLSIFLLVSAACSSGTVSSPDSDTPRGPRRAPLSAKQEQQIKWQEQQIEKLDRLTKRIASTSQADLSSAYFERANVHQELGEYGKAIADLKEAIRLKPNFSAAYAKLSQCYDAKRQPFEARLARGWSEYYDGRAGTAIQTFSEAIRLNPQQPDAWRGRSKAYLADYNAYEALADLDMVIKLDPGSTDSYFDRGKIASSVNRLDLAVKDFNVLLSIKPNHVEGLYERGSALAAQGQSEKALRDLGQVIQLDPRHARAWVGRAQVRLTKGDLDQAWADSEEALRVAPGIPQASIIQGSVLLLKNRNEDAVQRFDQVVRSSPFYTEVAIAAYNEVLSRVPTLGTAYHARGVAQYQAVRLPHATEDLTRALTLSVDKPQVLYDRGMVYLRSGHYRQAIDDFEAALRSGGTFKGTVLSPKAYLISQDHKSEARAFNRIGGLRDPDITKNLAWAYYLNGEDERALRVITQVIENRRQDHEAYFFAGLIHARRGNLPTALAMVETAVYLEPQFQTYRSTLAELRKEQQRLDSAQLESKILALVGIAFVVAAKNRADCIADPKCFERMQREELEQAESDQRKATEKALHRAFPKTYPDPGPF